MKTRTWIFLCSGLFLLGLVITLFLTPADNPPETEDLWKNTLSVRYELREGEVGRRVEYYPDLVTPRYALADLVDGNSQELFYRKDGTLEKSTTYGELVNGSRSVLRISVMDSDGVTFIEDKSFFESGNPKSLLVLEDPDTSLQKMYYDKEGWTLALSRTISRANEDRAWFTIAESAFRENGSKSKTFEIEEGVETTTFFDAEENVSQLLVLNRNKDLYTERDFGEDGETVIRSVDQDDDGTRMSLHRPDGTVLEQREWWGEVGASGMHVHKFDEEGRKIISQWWLIMDGELYLRQVRVIDPAGGFDRNMLIFETNGEGVGKVQYEMDYHSPRESNGPHTYREFHPDGTLKAEKIYSTGSELVSEKSFAPEDKVLVEHDPEWLEIQDVEFPPYVIEYIPDDE